jgi:hypothetical protein
MQDGQDMGLLVNINSDGNHEMKTTVEVKAVQDDVYTEVQ